MTLCIAEPLLHRRHSFMSQAVHSQKLRRLLDLQIQKAHFSLVIHSDIFVYICHIRLVQRPVSQKYQQNLDVQVCAVPSLKGGAQSNVEEPWEMIRDILRHTMLNFNSATCNSWQIVIPRVGTGQDAAAKWHSQVQVSWSLLGASAVSNRVSSVEDMLLAL